MSIDESDFLLFKAEIKDVKPIKHDRADVGTKVKNCQLVAQHRKNAIAKLNTDIVIDGISDQFLMDVGAEEFLLWAKSGVQQSLIQRLRKGLIAFEGSIDFHGLTVTQARELLWEFLAEAEALEVRCVRITHGKAARKDNKMPIMKSHVNTWLRQHPLIIGFSSCLAKHGGTGAVYVLLKRNMLEGRDE